MEIIGVVFPVFGIIFLGWLLRKIGLVKSDSISILNNFAYYVAFPALIFYSLYNIDFSIISYDILTVNVISIFSIMFLSFIISKILKLDNKTKASVIFCSFFGNTVYMGFPLSELSFGTEGVGLAAIISVFYMIIGLTLGIFIIQYYSAKKTDKKNMLIKMLKIPLIWGAIIGLLFSYSLIRIPEPFLKLLNMLGSSASPVALFALGVFLYGSIEKRNIGKVALISTLKLIILPIIVLSISILLGFSGKQKSVTILEAGMPIAITTFVLAEQFDMEKKMVANSIIITTIISILSVSIMLSLIGGFP
jgi:predicted permease